MADYTQLGLKVADSARAAIHNTEIISGLSKVLHGGP